MMSIDYIVSLSRKRGEEARKCGLQPAVLSRGSEFPEAIRAIPNLGSYRAVKFGWTLQEIKTVDKSGFGAEDEPALTYPAFLRWIDQYKGNPNIGWAIIEEGEFQIVIARFKLTGDNAKPYPQPVAQEVK